MAQPLDDQAIARFDRVLLSSSATDVLIATFCAKEGHELLHHDRNFDFMAKRLGLKVAKTG